MLPNPKGTDIEMQSERKVIVAVVIVLALFATPAAFWMLAGANSADILAVGMVLLGVLAPIALGVGVVVYGMMLRHREIAMLVKERELLIEKGVTNLPPLVLPATEKRRDGVGNLKWGLVLVAIAAASVASYLVSAPEIRVGGGGLQSLAFLHFGIFIGAVGLALVVFHFIARAYRDQDAEPPPAASQTSGNPPNDAEGPS
jgi:hypothetical protein